MEFKIGRKIKKLRELKGLSQENMAEELKMSAAGYGRIEREEVDVNIERLHQISQILGMNIEDVINFNERTVFNNYDNTKVEQQIGYYHISGEFKKLYEDKITLLEEKIEFLQQKIQSLEGK